MKVSGRSPTNGSEWQVFHLSDRGVSVRRLGTRQTARSDVFGTVRGRSRPPSYPRPQRRGPYPSAVVTDLCTRSSAAASWRAPPITVSKRSCDKTVSSSSRTNLGGRSPGGFRFVVSTWSLLESACSRLTLNTRSRLIPADPPVIREPPLSDQPASLADGGQAREGSQPVAFE